MTINIAVVIPKYGLIGGAESFVYELCERLARRSEFKIHVFANAWQKANPRIRYHAVSSLLFPRFLRPIRFAYLAGKQINPDRFNLIHSHERVFNMNLFTFHGIPHKTWVEKRGKKHMSFFDRSLSWVEKKGIGCPDLKMIMPVSNLVKDELIKSYPLSASKIKVVHPGVSAERFSDLNRKQCRADINRRHQIDKNDVIVLFVAMNFEIKRLELVLKGMHALKSRHQNPFNLKLLVVGKGNERFYMSLARDLNIGDRLIFAGVLNDIEPYYRGSDIFVMPSVYDTFGLSVLEAMAAGLPPVISSAVGAKDLLTSGENGFVLSGKPQPDELADRLQLLTDQSVRLEMGRKAEETALNQSWEKTADQISRVYHATKDRMEDNRHP